MHVFDKLMEGKHHEIVSENDDDSMIIENTTIFFNFGQTNTPDKPYIKIIIILTIMMKLLEPEAAPENKPVQYTADFIVEIKKRDGNVVPMRALRDT
jgi:hypothetical protein